MKTKNIAIVSTPCNLGEGFKVQVFINEMRIYSGTEVKIERRFSGGKQSSRFQAAKYIRSIRKLWDSGVLLDTVEGAESIPITAPITQ